MGDATGNELTGSRWQKKKPMNDKNNPNKTLRGESSEILSQMGVTADSAEYMNRTEWQQCARVSLAFVNTYKDIYDQLEEYRDCAFTWSPDRKSIIVWRPL